MFENIKTKSTQHQAMSKIAFSLALVARVSNSAHCNICREIRINRANLSTIEANYRAQHCWNVSPANGIWFSTCDCICAECVCVCVRAPCTTFAMAESVTDAHVPISIVLLIQSISFSLSIGVYMLLPIVRCALCSCMIICHLRFYYFARLSAFLER